MTKKNTFSALENLKELSVSPGAVYIGPWANIDHEKFLIVAGIDQDKILVCSVMINSQINQYILKRPKMLACQLELKKADYDFLSHDSYVNCAQPIKANFEHFIGDEVKYCGILKDADFARVKQLILSSGMLTAEDIAKFFS